jgi:hypothetical protein
MLWKGARGAWLGAVRGYGACRARGRERAYVTAAFAYVGYVSKARLAYLTRPVLGQKEQRAFLSGCAVMGCAASQPGADAPAAGRKAPLGERPSSAPLASPPPSPPQSAPSRGETLTPAALARLRSDFLRHASAGALLDSYELGDTVGALPVAFSALCCCALQALALAPPHAGSAGATVRLRCASRRGRPRGNARAARGATQAPMPPHRRTFRFARTPPARRSPHTRPTPRQAPVPSAW